MRKAFTHIQHYYILAVVCMVGLIIWLPDSGYDKYFWVTWAKYIKLHGGADAYNNPDINYHPVILLIIQAFAFFYQGIIDYTNINWLKVPTALFDWGIVIIAVNALKDSKKNLQWGLLLVLNPAFWYNTIIWGQFDSIWVFFTLLALYCANKGKLYFSMLAFLLAINTKLFAVFFLPFLLLFWIKLKPDTRFPKVSKFNDMTGFKVIVIKLLFYQLLLLVQFLFTTHYSVIKIIRRSTEYYSSLSRNAYNVWYWLFDNPVSTNDDSFLIPSILFVGAIFCWLIYLQYKGKTSIWAIAALASLTFFFFLTRMHERYAHAALVFSFMTWGLTPQPPLPKRGGEKKVLPLWGEGFRKGAPFFLISFAYLFNLDAVMQMLHNGLGLSIDYTAIWFNPKLIATLYFIACLLILYNVLKSPKPQLAKQEGQGGKAL